MCGPWFGELVLVDSSRAGDVVNVHTGHTGDRQPVIRNSCLPTHPNQDENGSLSRRPREAAEIIANIWMA
jgi:hypothetical protein